MGSVYRRTWWLLGGLLGTAVLLIGAVWIGGNTDAGRAGIERLTGRLTSGHVRLVGLGGFFPTELTLDELQLADERGVWLSAEHVTLHWSPLRLLSYRIQADDLRVARLHMERLPVSKDGGGGSVTIPHIDVAKFAVQILELGAPLAGAPATLSAQGSTEWRSLEDAVVDVGAHRIDGDGNYQVHLRFDAKRMDAALSIHEPAGGPLENLLQMPGLGALAATASLAGPRAAALVDVKIDAGVLHAAARGSLDLTHGAAALEYSLNSSAMSPRDDVAWQRLDSHGRWRGPFTAPLADGDFKIEGLHLGIGIDIARATAALGSATGVLKVSALIEGLTIPGPQPQLLQRDPLTVEASMRLSDARRPVEVTARHRLLTLRGTAVTAGSPSAVVDINTPDVAAFAALGGQDVHGAATVTARVSGSPGDLQLAIDAGVTFGGGKAPWLPLLGRRATLKFAGTLDPEKIRVERLQLGSDAITFAASGEAVRAVPAARSGTSASGKGLDTLVKSLQAQWELGVANLGALSPDIAGSLKASGKLRGPPSLLSGDADVTSTIAVRGSTAGTVTASVRAAGLPSKPSGTAELHGALDGAPLKLDVALERNDRGELRGVIRQADWKTAHAEGEVAMRGDFAPTRGQVRLKVAQLGDFDRLLGLTLTGSATASAGFKPVDGRTALELRASGDQLALGTLKANVQVTGDGTFDALGLELAAQLPDLYGAPSTVKSKAVLNLGAKTLVMSTALIDYRAQSLSLLAPSTISFDPGLAVDSLKLGAGEAVLQLEGKLSPALEARVTVRQVKPALVNVFLPGLLADGTIDGGARLQGTLAAPIGRVRLNATGIRFANDAASDFPALDLHARADLTGDVATLDARLKSGASPLLTVTGDVPLNAGGSADLKVLGKLDLGLINPVFEARGMHAAGQLGVDATVTGPPADPKIGGTVTLAQASIRDYGRGVNLTDISAKLVGSDGTLKIDSFDAKAASGHLGVTGTVGVLEPKLPVDLTITARNAQPIASSLVTANLDADLRLTGTARERLDVAGKIHLNRTTIGIPNSLPPDVAVLDVRRRGQAAPQGQAKSLVIGLDITLQAPQEILVQGRGLDAELGGEIHLGGTTESPIASGGFEMLRGSFSLAGNRLNFTPGPSSRISFDGAGLRKGIDPTLDFTAQTTVSDVTVRLNISGYADAPKFEFTSSPVLPQDEIMARLLFGENAAQLSALQAAQIAAALATLTGVGGGGFNPLVKLQKSLGLDRLTVGSGNSGTTTTEPSGASIAAGRYISKRIYIEGKQTTAGNSQVQVDVDLTKHLKLQTRLGNGSAVSTQGTTPDTDPGSSVGLSYQFEY